MQSETARVTGADYAPRGRLRAALNFGNPVLVRRDGDGRAVGISVDLAAELARSLGVDLELVAFERAMDVVGSAGSDAWDVCFLAVDPERSRTIAFTSPYVRISGCYLVGAAAAARTNEDVAANGLRIGVVEGSAYSLFLSRQPGADSLVTLPSFDLALAALDADRVDGIAGIEQVMAREAARRPGARVLAPPFMEIRQAIGVPLTREYLRSDLQARLSGLLQSGELSGLLERHGVTDDRVL
jgi:polar amino acid transport system substrate-binding protein